MSLIKKYFSKISTFYILINYFKKFKDIKKLDELEKNLIIVNQYFPPDFASTGQLIEELTHNLRNENFNVKVLTGMPAYNFNQKFAKPFEKRKKTVVIRSKLSRIIPKKLKGKIFNSVLFCLRVLTHLLFLNKKNHLIIYTTEPAYLPVFAWVYHKIKRIPYIILIYDIFPEILNDLELMSKDNFIIKIWRKLNKLSFDSSKEIIVLSSAMKNKIHNNYLIPTKKINNIPSWADEKSIYYRPKSKNYFLKKNKLENYFIVLYSGNQGRCHDLNTLLNAAKILKNKKDILFLFVGDGFQNKSLKKECINNNIKNCMFLPFQEKKDLPFILSSASIGVVTLSKKISGLLVPSKLYGHLACGTPIAAISGKGSYIEKLIKQHNCGKWFENGNHEDLAEWILKVYQSEEKSKKMGESSLNLFLKEFTLDIVSKKYLKIINRNF